MWLGDWERLFVKAGREAQKASLLGYAGEAEEYWSHMWRDLGAGRSLRKLKGIEELKKLHYLSRGGRAGMEWGHLKWKNMRDSFLGSYQYALWRKMLRVSKVKESLCD